MGTVVPFRRGYSRPDKATAQASRSQAAERAKAVMKTAGLGVLGVLRYAVFLVLLALRPLVRWLLGFASGVTLLGLVFLAVFMSGPDKMPLLRMCAEIGFGSFVLLWFYDMLLLRLSPTPIILT